MDLENEVQVTTESGQAVANELGASYFEVSSRTGYGIEELFIRIAEASARQLKSSNVQNDTKAVTLDAKTDNKT